VCKGEANTPVPLASPKLPPAVSYPRRLSSLPLFLSLTSGTRLSAARAREAERGLRARVGRVALLGHAVAGERARSRPWRIPGPAQSRMGVRLGFSNFVSFILFHRFVYRFKNVYLLIGRSKCCGSNFVEFLVVSSLFRKYNMWYVG
jgi:hypothetical protein